MDEAITGSHTHQSCQQSEDEREAVMKKVAINVISVAIMVLGAALIAHPAPLSARPEKTSGSQTPLAEGGKISRAGLQVAGQYGNLPLTFEENRGQAAPDVKFLSRGAGYNFSVTPQGSSLMLTRNRSRRPILRAKSVPQANPEKAVLHMALVGSNPSPRVQGLEKQPGIVNYFDGTMANKNGHTGIRTFGKVQLDNVYAGIDLVFHGNQRQLEYDFAVAPGVDPRVIRMAFQGADKLEIADGELVLHLGDSAIRQHKPVTYQQSNGGRREVQSRYILLSANEVGFEIGAYDRSQALVIDPVLTYSTYFGGTSDDVINSIAVDSAGNAYVAGWTNSLSTTSQIFLSKINAAGTSILYTQYIADTAHNCGSYGTGVAVNSAGEAFVSGMYGTVDQWGFCNNKYAYTGKLNAAGTAFIYSFFWGGGDDHANAVALDSAGNAYFTGQTQGNWPVSAGVFQSNGGFPGDAFVLKLDSTGHMLYSSYLGGSSIDEAFGIAVDSNKNAVIVGNAQSSDFPTTTGAYQKTNSSWVACFVSKVNSSGSALPYSSYLAGTRGENCTAVAVDSANKIYITGNTESDDFPTTAGAYDRTCGTDGLCNWYFACDPGCNDYYFEDAIFAKFDPTLSGAASLVYSSYFGGENRELGQGIAVDSAGNAYVTGRTISTFMPTVNPIQGSIAGDNDVFVAEMNPSGSSLLFSTYLGGANYDEAKSIALDSSANIYLAGQTGSGNFPVVGGVQNTNAGGYDGFLTKIGTATTASLTSVALNPASVIGGAASTGTVTLSAVAPAGGAVVTLSSNNTNAATVPASVTVAAGATTATFTPSSKNVTVAANVTITATYSGVSKTATLTVNPVAIASLGLNPGTLTGGSSSTATVTLNAAAPAGGAVVSLASNQASATVPASLTIAAGATSGTFTVSTSSVTSMVTASITATYNGSISSTLTINPAASVSLSSVTVSPTSVTGGTSSTGTVTLSGAAPTGGVVITLTSNNAAASVPASVTVAAGATTATFSATSSPVTAKTTVTLTASYNGTSKTATLTVNAPALSSVTLNPSSLVGGNASTGTVTLTGNVAAGGSIVVNLSSSNTAAATLPASVTVAAGAKTATFTISTSPVTASTAVTITGTYNGVSKTKTLTVNLPALSSVTFSPGSVTGGTSSTGTVKLSGAAPTGGIVVTLSSNNAAATVPASVTVAAGATSATFTATTKTVTTSTAVTVSATYNAVTKNGTLTVKP